MNKFTKLLFAAALGLFAVSPQAHAAQGTGCMPTTGTISGLTFAQDVNAGIAALISSNSGSSAPATDCSAVPIKGQVWLDTSVTPNMFRMFDGTAWVAIGALDSTNNLWAPPVGGGIGSVASAGTTDLCTVPNALVTITGTTTITGFGSSCVIGIRKTLVFNGAVLITYNATSLIVPGALSYTTAAGDVAEVVYTGAGNWRILSIGKADGSAITNPALPLGTVLFGDYATLPPKTLYGYGQAVSRATYPAYTAAVTRSQTGTLTAGNATITSVTNTDGLGPGMPIEGTGIQAGSIISSVTGSTIVMNQTATVNGSQTNNVFITGYGTSGNSTTVGIKDCRGRAIAGRDAPLGVTASRLTAGFFTNPNMINAGGGAQSTTLVTANLPAYTPVGSITNGGISVSTSVSISHNAAAANASTTGGGAFAIGGATATISATATSSASQGASTFTGSAQGGTSTAFGNVTPTVLAECVVVVLQ